MEKGVYQKIRKLHVPDHGQNRILSGRPPRDGVNTHVDVARACVRLVKGCGAIPVIGDSPGGSVSPKEVYEASGFSSMAKEEGAELAKSIA